MATVVEKTGIKREKGWLYFLDKGGDVSRARMARGGGKAPKGREKVAKLRHRAGRGLPLLHRQERSCLQGEDEALHGSQDGAQEAGTPQDDGAHAAPRHAASRPRASRPRRRARKTARKPARKTSARRTTAKKRARR